jgi:hypothetical protein
MPTLTDTKELQKVLAKILQKAPLSAEMKLHIVNTLVPAIQAGGGLNTEDPKAVEKLKQGIKAVLTMEKLTSPNSGVSPGNRAAILANRNDILSGIFDEKPTPAQNKKVAMGMAYLKVLEQEPGKDIRMDLAMLDPKHLTPQDKERLVADLGKVFGALNDMQKDPGMKLDAAKLAALMEMIKKEIKEPGSTKELANKEDKGLTDSLSNLFGVDPRIPGKIAGPLMVLAGNTMGIVDNYPALGGSNAPIDSFSGNVLNASRQSATGAYTLTEDRDQDLGSEFNDNFASLVSTAVESVSDVTVDAEVDQGADAQNGSKPAEPEPVAEKGGLTKQPLPPKVETPEPAPEPQAEYKSPFNTKMQPPMPK